MAWHQVRQEQKPSLLVEAVNEITRRWLLVRSADQSARAGRLDVEEVGRRVVLYMPLGVAALVSVIDKVIHQSDLIRGVVLGVVRIIAGPPYDDIGFHLAQARRIPGEPRDLVVAREPACQFVERAHRVVGGEMRIAKATLPYLGERRFDPGHLVAGVGTGGGED